MIITCSQCQAQYRYDVARFGAVRRKRVKCPKCANVFEVENPSPDDDPDSTLFRVKLDVPQDGTTKSLVFTTQFLTSELEVPSGDRGSDRAIVQSQTFTFDSEEQELGRVASSASPEDPPVTRAINVEGAATVDLTFLLTDGDDEGHRDSGLLLSGVYFSEFDAELLRLLY